MSIFENEVLCLLGENGSGKTTLMNILFGIIHQDCGDVVIRGVKTNISSPKDAHDYGIGMVHQHFMLLNQNTVFENIIIGEERTRMFLHPDRQRDQLEDLIERFDFRLDLDEKICNLSVGMKQRVEILKVLYRGMDILIFDEPTAVLTPQESEQMLQIIRQLKQDGKTIVYITHKLNEALEIGDRIAVLRKGKLVDVRNAGECDALELARMMVGHDLGLNPDKTTDHVGGTVLSISNLRLRDERKGCSLEVNKGEIVGIAGVDGNGQLELEQFIVGLRKTVQGKIYLDGIDIWNLSVRKRKEMGFAHIPSDRHRYAMISSESLCDNYYLSYYDNPEFRGTKDFEEFYKKASFRKDKKERRRLKKYYDEFSGAKGTKGTAIFEGDIDSKYIKGSKNYERNSLKQISKYIKNNPKRFMKGVGKTALGASLIGGGVLLSTGKLNKNKNDNTKTK